MSSIRGVRFQNLDNNDYTLYDILKPLNIELYDWRLSYINIYGEGWEFDQPCIMKGKELLDLLETGYTHAIFGEFIGYKSKANLNDIDTYEEFLNSHAEVIFLLVDGGYFDAYIKDIEITNHYFTIIKQLDLNPELIDEDDSRTRLTVS
ncbi:DUF2691 family protein [Paenibacillus crassostreae]|uniref:Uncharacterized protein n=1 Tax=Paenibacillus crassostreae TaxID=1763538 RepID=A0A167BW60_9BACL|nr:DUF2691 family protein [Paenibacillus crassostreae]AOZ92562.1 hypothetical protein LPB68_10155 [Paenibacillus crassostreae]OAB72511.1 hypothetical protein PNBC_16600 [Paenibacillus crassostreae]